MNQEEVLRLYEEHGRPLLGYACALLRNRATAEDVLHTVFLKLLDGTVAICDPPPYLYRAVRNAALNVRRNETRHVALDNGSAWFEPISLMSDMALAVQEALIRLPCEQREVVVLHIWGEKTFSEIAEIIEIPCNTVASRYRYALSALRRLLQPPGGLDEAI
jgi:RNA polymerase sigma-70 factor (ECF subfamily)